MHICRLCFNKKRRLKNAKKKTPYKIKMREIKMLKNRGLKKCSLCGQIKPVSEFYFKSKKNLRFRSECSKCTVLLTGKYKKENRDKIKIRNAKNAEKIYLKGKEYREKNKEKLKIKYRLNARKKRKENPQYRLAVNLRRRVLWAIKLQGGSKSKGTEELIGCSAVELCAYIESLFTTGMSWLNYGRGGWHLDHILPCDSFDLTDVDQQKKCFHWSNLQPLWEIDNLRKGSKIL